MSGKELTPEELEELKNRHIRSFVLRRGHISVAQERAFEEIFPKYEVKYEVKPFDAEVNFLGCEVFVAGVGALSKRIDEMGLENIRIARHDAVEVVRDMLAPDSLSGIHVYFPDPWRKARHHKRRLIRPEIVSLLASRLQPGAYIHCATDWENYAEQMLEVLSAEPLLKNLHPEGFSPVMANPLCERPCTKFQARGERLGHGVWDLVFVRV